MANIIFDKDGILEEPCLSCDKAYLETYGMSGWHCDEKECQHKADKEREE